MKSFPILAVLALSLTIAGAQETEPVSTAGQVRIGDRVVLSLRVDEGSFTPADRAAMAHSLLREALVDPRCAPEEWKIEPEGETRILAICGKPVIIVTPADAATLSSCIRPAKQSIMSSLKL